MCQQRRADLDSETTRTTMEHRRVHKALLARQSQAFEDVFHVGAGDAGNVFECRPTVELPDPAEDVEALLNAYIPSYVLY